MLHTLNLAYGIHWPSKVFLQGTERQTEIGLDGQHQRQDRT